MSEFKIEKNIPFTSKKTKGSATARYIHKYKWITELDDGDSIVCNRRQATNIISFCKRWGIKTRQKWVDDRSWYEHGYAEDGKYRLWFYPSTNKEKDDE
jgi:hypothetical protein